MKHAHYDHKRKVFTEKSVETLPRLLTVQEEALLREGEDRNPAPRQPGHLTPVQILNWASLYSHW